MFSSIAIQNSFKDLDTLLKTSVRSWCNKLWIHFCILECRSAWRILRKPYMLINTSASIINIKILVANSQFSVALASSSGCNFAPCLHELYLYMFSFWILCMTFCLCMHFKSIRICFNFCRKHLSENHLIVRENPI